MDSALWIPLAALFISALVGALVRRHTKDSCMKVINGSFVFVLLKGGKWIWGNLIVYSNTLEVQYPQPKAFNHSFQKMSYVFFEHELESIHAIIRPSPKEDSTEHADWLREIERLQKPSLARRLSRKVRNTFNMLRDAFAQSITMIFGAVKKKTALAKAPIGDDKVGEVGKSLISVIPNSYEPVLEKYLGQYVVVETIQDKMTYEHAGVLQEYTAKYVLVRDVEFLKELPPAIEGMGLSHCNFDVAFARPANTVRHRAAMAVAGSSPMAAY
ncbi:MAG: hypothetical protein ACO1QB_16215 [Verrucomicrobiales bacterium]